jgi:lipopolysaccharide/colanic/teichoic acid biosynthesis glycosyltransferase
VHPRAFEREREFGSVTETMALLPRQRSERLNRAVNFALGLIGLIALFPFMLLVAIAVKLTSRGPVFYTQTRVGLDRRWKRTLALHERRLQDLGGAAFTIYKFRSMRVDAEKNGAAVWATKRDSRVTPIGGALRTLRLDELPQLINVVKGDMNIVGPRPERPSILVRLRQDIREYPLRQRVKPGLTGLAQINQCPDQCLDDVRKKVSFDLEYLRTQSLAEDLRIMVMTVPAVLMKTRGW